MSGFWEDTSLNAPQRFLDGWAMVEESGGQKLVAKLTPRESASKPEGWPTAQMESHERVEFVLARGQRPPALVQLLRWRYPRARIGKGGQAVYVHKRTFAEIVQLLVKVQDAPPFVLALRRLTLDDEFRLQRLLEDLERGVLRDLREEWNRELRAEGDRKRAIERAEERAARERHRGAEVARRRR